MRKFALSAVMLTLSVGFSAAQTTQGPTRVQGTLEVTGATTLDGAVAAPTLSLSGSGCGSGTYAKADGTGCGVGPGGAVNTVSGTAPVVSSGGTTPAISMHVADASDNGYLSSTDWAAFNGKQATLTNPVTGPGSGATVGHLAVMGNTSGTSITDGGPVGAGTVTAVSVATANGFQGSSSGGAAPALTLNVDSTHVLPVNTGVSTTYLNGAGAYTTPSGGGGSGTVNSGTTGQIAYYASGGTTLSGTNTLPAGTLVGTTDAQALTNKIYSAINITTSTSVTASGTNAYYYNQDATASAAITYTLPTPAAGLQFCFKNSNNGSAADTGAIELLVANTSTQSIIYNGAKSTAAGNIQSSGAAGDSACVIGISTTQWEAYVGVGVWAVH